MSVTAADDVLEQPVKGMMPITGTSASAANFFLIETYLIFNTSFQFIVTCVVQIS